MAESIQKLRYGAIHEAYEKHYYSPMEMTYREHFIKHLFKNINLNRKRVVDLACDSRHNSLFLLKYFSDVKMSGFDVSKKAYEIFFPEKWCFHVL